MFRLKKEIDEIKKEMDNQDRQIEALKLETAILQKQINELKK